MKASYLSLATLVTAVSLFASPAAIAAAEQNGSSDQDKQNLVKEVETELANARWLETYNLNWRIWAQVAIVALSAGVTILTGLQAFGGYFSGQRIKIATLIVSATATAAALIPKNFQLQDEEYKYGSAVAQLIEVRDDLKYGHKSISEVLPKFYAIEQEIHGQYNGSVKPASSGTPTASPSASS